MGSLYQRFGYLKHRPHLLKKNLRLYPTYTKLKLESIVELEKEEQQCKTYGTIFSDIWDAKLFPPRTAAVVHNACPLPKVGREEKTNSYE